MVYTMAVDDISIAQATPADIPVMCAWGAAHSELWTARSAGWYTPADLFRWMERGTNDIFLIARSGDVPIGMCVVYSLYTWAMCDGLFVLEQHRRQGVGQTLLTEAARLVRQQGISALSLIVQTDNTAARDFYTAEGFTPGFQFTWMEKDV